MTDVPTRVKRRSALFWCAQRDRSWARYIPNNHWSIILKAAPARLQHYLEKVISQRFPESTRDWQCYFHNPSRTKQSKKETEA